MKKDFKNIVVINMGHMYEAALEEDFSVVPAEYVRHKWFDYVVSDDIIDELKSLLRSSNVDKPKLQRIIYDDVINTRNVVYSSDDEKDAVKEASRLADNNLVIQLT
jgi:hypothetical protein